MKKETREPTRETRTQAAESTPTARPPLEGWAEEINRDILKLGVELGEIEALFNGLKKIVGASPTEEGIELDRQEDVKPPVDYPVNWKLEIGQASTEQQRELHKELTTLGYIWAAPEFRTVQYLTCDKGMKLNAIGHQTYKESSKKRLGITELRKMLNDLYPDRPKKENGWHSWKVDLATYGPEVRTGLLARLKAAGYKIYMAEAPATEQYFYCDAGWNIYQLYDSEEFDALTDKVKISYTGLIDHLNELNERDNPRPMGWKLDLTEFTGNKGALVDYMCRHGYKWLDSQGCPEDFDFFVCNLKEKNPENILFGASEALYNAQVLTEKITLKPILDYLGKEDKLKAADKLAVKLPIREGRPTGWKVDLSLFSMETKNKLRERLRKAGYVHEAHDQDYLVCKKNSIIEPCRNFDQYCKETSPKITYSDIENILDEHEKANATQKKMTQEAQMDLVEPPVKPRVLDLRNDSWKTDVTEWDSDQRKNLLIAAKQAGFSYKGTCFMSDSDTTHFTFSPEEGLHGWNKTYYDQKPHPEISPNAFVLFLERNPHPHRWQLLLDHMYVKHGMTPSPKELLDIVAAVDLCRATQLSRELEATV